MRKEAEPKENRDSTEQEPAAQVEATSEAARVAELEQRCAELETRWLRSQADYQNLRRRAQQELESALLFTLQPLLEQLLLVSDYLDMALATKVGGEEAKSLAAGVQLTRSKLAQALELAEVRPVSTGGTFDPALHEASESRPTHEQAPGTILATVRTGYTWQGRILRPARVVVAVAPGPSADGSRKEEGT